MSWLDWIIPTVALNKFIYHRLDQWLNPSQPQLGAVNNIKVPRSDEGAPIPIVYGRCRVRSPVLVWSGNSFFTGEDPHYEIDMTFVLGIPFYGVAGSSDPHSSPGAMVLGNVWAGDIRLDPFINNGSRALWSVSVNSNLGGPGSGGGIYGRGEMFDGTFNVVAGGSTQTEGRMSGSGVNDTLIPGYRNLGLCTMYDWSIGESPNITGYSFEVLSMSTTTPSDMGPGIPGGGQELADDADPAAVIYDLLTSPWGKLAIPVSKVDKPSFSAASLTLFNEGHGYSRAIETPDDAASIIQDVLRQIDGMIYEEPATGKIVLRLVRNDYNVIGLQDINPDNANLISYSVQGWNETINQVRAKWTDRSRDYVDGVSIAQNGANATLQGKLRNEDVSFPGCCVETIARQLASRELAVKSRPAVVATVAVDRSFYATRPVDVLTLTWPELGINKMVMRVARVDLGQLHDGKITLDLIRDVFDVKLGGFPAF